MDTSTGPDVATAACGEKSRLDTLLGALGDVLRGISVLTAATLATSRVAAQSPGPEARIDSMIATISSIVDPGPEDDPGGQHLRVTDLSPDVAAYAIRRARIRAHQPLDVIIGVVASARLGGLLLSMGSTQIDLAAANSSFVLQIGGSLGMRELNFASGTSIADIAAAIHWFSHQTGTDVVLSGTALKLQSVAYGSGQFASVRVINDGGIRGNRIGIYALSPTDFNRAVPSSRIPFESAVAWQGFSNEGQDLSASVNGVRAECQGTALRTQTPDLIADIWLTTGPAVGPANAQTLGTFRAFRIQHR